MIGNPQELCREAQHFTKYGYYCGDPAGSAAYFTYWSEQRRRCIEGYSCGDLRITGHHYNYLNFTRIKLTDTSKRSKKKIITFPSFWDGDYEYFWIVDIARHGITPEEYEALGLEITVHTSCLEGGKHVIVGKARRKGYSFKNASIATNTYNTVRDSYNLLCAHDKKYLYPKGIMTMVTDNMNFINEHTGWGKRRQVVDKQNHRKASYLEYINGKPVEKGYKSEVEAITFKDNSDAARGKDANLIIFEECGTFDNLKASYLATKPSVEDGGGDITTGLMLLFGTGGDMSGGTIDFESIFYNPEAYNILPIENIWDEASRHTDCGYFVPSFKNKVGFMDKFGNSLKDKARQAEEAVRENLKRNAKDANVLDMHVTEYPFSPREAFAQHTSNIFPTATLLEWRNELVKSGMHTSVGVNGVLAEKPSGVVFRPSETARPVARFPHQKGDYIHGCVVVYQSPFYNNGTVPHDLYIIVHDPYAQDGKGASLGAAYVIKRINKYSSPDDMIVASYIGRPDTQDEYNKNLFLLSQYYNARIGFENDRGEVIPYAKRYKMLHMLMEEVEIFDNHDNVRIRKLGRSFGCSMGSKQRKGQAEIYLRDWLGTKRGKGPDGEIKLNLHYIYELPLIDELIKYGHGNSDRVSALLVGMFHLKELHSREVAIEVESTRSDFFEREFF